ncbi:ROK family protein [Streptomyces sp. G1]|uniref:ROK family protein n=1 Tax=Streptomyces sp. G1 TaxID=361572 RepID=UPI00202F55AC|nr:ROK family protein [Streptomyces sp. G1]MCM1976489.1 ROK family protein [Streptomyces sp. G1]
MLVDGIARFPQVATAELQARVVGQLVRVLRERFLAAPRPPSALAVAFAGLVGLTGAVVDAPTIWGRRGPELPLAQILGQEFGVPVRVINDVTAAGWRYTASGGEGDDFFCMVTVSSGVGNKVFHRGEVLLPQDGRGGEIGHLRVDFASDAPRCDCGERGHLGAIASGRGALGATRGLARRLPGAFARSILSAACGSDPGRLTAQQIASGIHGHDSFAVQAVTPGVRHLARTLATVHTALGVRRFVVMGGFARAAGEPYLRLLGEEMTQAGSFLLPPAGEERVLLHPGAPDDDDGLIGCVGLLDRSASLP